MNNSSFSANEIPLEVAKLHYSYNPDTGMLFKLSDGSMKKIGYVDSRGYLSINHDSVILKVHRLAYALHYGMWPDNELDHINRDPLDNRISNLRLADRFINNQNREFKPKCSLWRKWDIFNALLAGEAPSSIPDLDRYFPYSFKNG